jgi:hypothetical protein
MLGRTPVPCGAAALVCVAYTTKSWKCAFVECCVELCSPIYNKYATEPLPNPAHKCDFASSFTYFFNTICTIAAYFLVVVSSGAMSTPAATIRIYKSTLDSLMSFVHEVEAGHKYGNDREYTNKELLEVTPNHVLKWMLLCTFGTTNMGVISDALCPMVRANTLQFWKKSISFFMPNRLRAWRTRRGEGNPTKRLEVNDLIKKVKRLKARKQGASSQNKATNYRVRIPLHP